MRTKTWAAVACAGLLAGGAVVAQPPKSEPAKTESKAEPAATDPPLNPLRAGAAAIAATIDGGRSAHALERGVPASDAGPPARKARPKSKPRRKA